MASASRGGSSRVSPVTSPTASPACAGGSARPNAVRMRARTVSAALPTLPGPATSPHPCGTSRAVTCRVRKWSSKPECSNGRALAAPRQLPPSTGGAPSPRTSARSRVDVSSTAVTRTTAHQPKRVCRGSVTTVASTSAAPPRLARSCSGPPRRPASDTTPSPNGTRAQATSAAAGRRRATAGSNAATIVASSAASTILDGCAPPGGSRVPARAPVHAPITAHAAHSGAGPLTDPTAQDPRARPS